jgi:hypothetical protein
MKRLAILSFAIATLLAPITVQAQSGCVRCTPHPHRLHRLAHLDRGRPARSGIDMGQPRLSGACVTPSMTTMGDMLRLPVEWSDC